MAQLPSKVKDLYVDAVSAADVAERHDAYMGELNKSIANVITDPMEIGRIKAGVSTFQDNNPVNVLEKTLGNSSLIKSLTPDAVGALNSALASQRQAQADLVKDISLSVPLNTSFAAYDLEAPAKLLTPRPTPLRNKIARKKGVGTAHRIKRITGYTGTGTGGQGNIFPGITETTSNTFGATNYVRGPKISYTADDKTFVYNTYSLSDQVSWDAQFSGMGYQDLRQLSSTSTLYASMLMEERMLLMARGSTANGYSGALAAPTITLTARAAGAGETPLSGVTTKVYVYATSDAGAFGQSVLSTNVNTAVSAGQVVDVTVTSSVAGALGYKVYVGTGAAQPADTAIFYAGRTATQVFTLQGALPVAGIAASTITADTSSYATGYDGILPTLLNPTSGAAVNTINSTFSTSNPGVEFQTVFGTIYDNVKGDPDEILLNGFDRKQISDSIKNGSTANYRMTISQTEGGDYVGGLVIGSLHNEITGKLVDLTVHPWLPQGVAPVMSYTLPIPDTEVSDVWSVFNVQDYMGVSWPVTQMTYDFSTYWRGTFVCYAPAWNGVVTGIKAA